MKQAFVGIICGIGLLLIVLSYAWLAFFGTRSNWSREDYQEHAEAVRGVHDLMHHHSHETNQHDHPASSNKTNHPQIREARERFERSHAALQNARNAHQRTVSLLKWSGAVFILIGCISFFAARES